MTNRPPTIPALAVLAFALAALAPRGTAAAAPLALDDAIKLALENNPRIKVSAYNPQIARANLLAAYGSFDPTLNFSRSYSESESAGVVLPPLRRGLSQSDDYRLSLDGLLPWGMSYSFETRASNPRGTGNAFTDNFSTFGGISITQPLLRGFGFGSTLANLRIAKASRSISDWQHRQTVIDIVTSVIIVYNNLQEARDTLRIARMARELAARTLSDNEKRFAIGAISEADVTLARAGVARSEESILIAERSVRNVDNLFRQLLGETQFLTNGPALETVELPPAPDITVDAAVDVKRAYELRPDYQSARLGLAIDRASSAAAQNALLPRLDFVGSYGYRGLDRDFATARGQVRDQDARDYSVGMIVSIPLTFASGRGRARAARLNVRQGEVDLLRLEQDIAINVTAAAGQVETTRLRVGAAKVALDLGQQALDAEDKKVKAGSSTTINLLQQQQQLTGVQNSYARALADQRRALANYERELGTTLLSRGIKVE